MNQTDVSAGQETLPLSLLPPLNLEEYDNVVLHVAVYDAIISLVESGQVSAGMLLPGENALSAYWNISRGTVRQGLRHLEEHGVIRRFRGRGSVILPQTQRANRDIQWYSDICRSCCTQTIDRIEISWKYDGSGRWVSSILGLTQGALLMLADIWHYSGEELCAVAKTHLPASMLERFGVDASDPQAIRTMLLETIPEQTYRAQTTLQLLTDLRDDIFGDDVFDDNMFPILFVEEILYDAQDRPLALNKNYLRAGMYLLHLGRSKWKAIGTAGILRGGNGREDE